MKYFIKNANIYNVNTGVFQFGNLFVEKGVISGLGNISQSDIPGSLDEIIDAKGNYVYPGIIDAHSHMGMWVYRYLGNDGNECSDPVTPYIRAIDGINPVDPGFSEAVKSGITTMMISPGSGNLIAGQVSILKPRGKSVSEMTVNPYAALKIALGENPISVYGPEGKSPSSRMGTAAIIENTLYEAADYFSNRKSSAFVKNRYWEIFVPLFEHKIPLKIHAHRADDILTAIRIAESFKLKYTLDHCTEGYLIVDELSQKVAPLLLGPLFMFKTKSELKNSTTKAAQILVENGCHVSITSDHPFSNGCFLGPLTGLLVKEGLDHVEALKMLTINPAKALGMEDQIGSLEVGKNADIVIYDGNPLELGSSVCLSMIDGIICYRRPQ